MLNNSNFVEPLFWIIMGVLYTLFVAGLAAWFKDMKIRMNWWRWTLVVLWFTFLSLVVAGGFTLIGENEKRAGLMFMAFSGPAILVAGIALGRMLIRDKDEEEGR